MSPKYDSGIKALGEVPFGTHLCQFYHTQEELIHLVAPYIKAGLENQEYCLWIVAAPFTVEEAYKSLAKTSPKIEQYLLKGQLEILEESQWYTKAGRFLPEQAMEKGLSKINEVIQKGFKGLRIAGGLNWDPDLDWKALVNYEATVNEKIGELPLIALCSYHLPKCGMTEVIDVVSHHQHALIKRKTGWAAF